jgi:NADH-quinone oxidoreductase subunit A
VIRSYLPALVFVGLGAAIGLVFAFGNALLGPRNLRPPPKATADPYECGLPSEVKKNFRFGISFYLIAMLFILFDIEVIFLYPVAIQLDAFGTFALVETIVFVVLLMIAFVYVWRRGALEWR